MSGAVQSAVTDLKNEVAESNVDTIDTEDGIVVYPFNNEAVDIIIGLASELGQDNTTIRVVLVRDGAVTLKDELNSLFATSIDSPEYWFELRRTKAIQSYFAGLIEDGTIAGATLEMPVSETVDTTVDETADDFNDDTGDFEDDNDDFEEDFEDDTTDAITSENDTPVVTDEVVETTPVIDEHIADILADKVLPDLPVIDEVVNKRMQGDFVASRTVVERARQDMIANMTEKRQNAYAEAERVVRETKLDDARDAHDATISQIRDNFDADEAGLQATRQEQYADEKEQAKQAMLEAWSKQYDEDHMADFDAETQAQIDALSEASEAEIEVETNNYTEFVDATVHALAEDEANAVTYDEQFAQFEDVVRRESDKLFARAQELEDADVQAINEARQAQAEAEAKLDALQSQLDVIKATQDDTINALVTQKVSEITVQSNSQIAEMQARNKDLVDELQTERVKTQSLVRNIDSLNMQLSRASMPVYATPQPAPSEGTASLTSSDATEEVSEPVETVPERHGVARKIIPVAVGGLLVLLGAGSGAMLNQHNVTNNHKTVVKQTKASSDKSSVADSSATSSSTANATTSSAQEQSSSTSIVGTQLPVTLQDGSVVTVTADTETSGHYTDQSGNSHTIYFTR